MSVKISASSSKKNDLAELFPDNGDDSTRTDDKLMRIATRFSESVNGAYAVPPENPSTTLIVGLKTKLYDIAYNCAHAFLMGFSVPRSHTIQKHKAFMNEVCNKLNIERDNMMTDKDEESYKDLIIVTAEIVSLRLAIDTQIGNYVNGGRIVLTDPVPKILRDNDKYKVVDTDTIDDTKVPKYVQSVFKAPSYDDIDKENDEVITPLGYLTYTYLNLIKNLSRDRESGPVPWLTMKLKDVANRNFDTKLKNRSIPAMEVVIAFFYLKQYAREDMSKIQSVLNRIESENLFKVHDALASFNEWLITNQGYLGTVFFIGCNNRIEALINRMTRLNEVASDLPKMVNEARTANKKMTSENQIFALHMFSSSQDALETSVVDADDLNLLKDLATELSSKTDPPGTAEACQAFKKLMSDRSGNGSTQTIHNPYGNFVRFSIHPSRIDDADTKSNKSSGTTGNYNIVARTSVPTPPPQAQVPPPPAPQHVQSPQAQVPTTMISLGRNGFSNFIYNPALDIAYAETDGETRECGKLDTNVFVNPVTRRPFYVRDSKMHDFERIASGPDLNYFATLETESRVFHVNNEINEFGFDSVEGSPVYWDRRQMYAFDTRTSNPKEVIAVDDELVFKNAGASKDTALDTDSNVGTTSTAIINTDHESDRVKLFEAVTNANTEGETGAILASIAKLNKETIEYLKRVAINKKTRRFSNSCVTSTLNRPYVILPQVQDNDLVDRAEIDLLQSFIHFQVDGFDDKNKNLDVFLRHFETAKPTSEIYRFRSAIRTRYNATRPQGRFEFNNDFWNVATNSNVVTRSKRVSSRGIAEKSWMLAGTRSQR